MNSFIPWIGSKRLLRSQIISMFPVCYEQYIEVFGGGGWILFAKSPGKELEVYNDLNGLLVNLFHCVRDHPQELMNELRYVLNSRIEFNRASAILARRGRRNEVQKAALYYQIIRHSYNATLNSFAARPHDLWSDYPIIEKASRRLKDVLIEHQDFEKLIRSYDGETSFFYCDPPYHNTEGYYKNLGEKGFGEIDHLRLQDTLLSIEGKFMLSYNDDRFIRELYNEQGIYIVETSRADTMRNRTQPKSKFPELIITNYDPYERAQQLSLFSADEEEESI